MDNNRNEKLRFTSNITTADGRLSCGKTYEGKFRYSDKWKISKIAKTQWRIEVVDNYGSKMTFDVGAFRSGDSVFW